MWLYQICSNYDPRAQYDPALGLISFHILNKLGTAPLGDATYQILFELWIPHSTISPLETLYSGERLRALGLLFMMIETFLDFIIE